MVVPHPRRESHNVKPGTLSIGTLSRHLIPFIPVRHLIPYDGYYSSGFYIGIEMKGAVYQEEGKQKEAHC